MWWHGAHQNILFIMHNHCRELRTRRVTALLGSVSQVTRRQSDPSTRKALLSILPVDSPPCPYFPHVRFTRQHRHHLVEQQLGTENQFRGHGLQTTTKKKNCSEPHMLNLLRGKSLERRARPPFLCRDRVWKFFVFLLFLIKQWNNSPYVPLT